MTLILQLVWFILAPNLPGICYHTGTKGCMMETQVRNRFFQLKIKFNCMLELVRWVMVFPTRGYKIRYVLLSKWEILQDNCWILWIDIASGTWNLQFRNWIIPPIAVYVNCILIQIFCRYFQTRISWCQCCLQTSRCVHSRPITNRHLPTRFKYLCHALEH